MPYTVTATITAAGLNDLVALLSRNNWLTNPAVLATVTDLHDLTMYEYLQSPNSLLILVQLRMQ
jgi:hypothetical protein